MAGKGESRYICECLQRVTDVCVHVCAQEKKKIDIRWKLNSSYLGLQGTCIVHGLLLGRVMAVFLSVSQPLQTICLTTGVEKLSMVQGRFARWLVPYWPRVKVFTYVFPTPSSDLTLHLGQALLGGDEKERRAERNNSSSDSGGVLLRLCLPAKINVCVFLSFPTENCTFVHASSFQVFVAILLSCSAEVVVFWTVVTVDQKRYGSAFWWRYWAICYHYLPFQLGKYLGKPGCRVQLQEHSSGNFSKCAVICDTAKNSNIVQNVLKRDI